MKYSFNRIIKKAKEVGLTDDEKDALRLRVVNHVENAPVTGAISWQEIPRRISLLSFLGNLSRSSVVIPALLVVMVFGGGALSFASSGSLPGDLTYPMKRMSERIDLAFAWTPGAEARVNAIQAVRRLEEAEALSAEGRLNEETKVALETSFSSSSQLALQHISKLDSEDKTASLKVLTEFKGNLNAHRDILQTIVAADLDTTASSTLSQEVQTVIAALNLPQATAIALGGETNDSTLEFQAKAKQQIADASRFANQNLTGEDKIKIENALIAAQASYENGSQALTKESLRDATALFKQAGDQAIQARAMAESYNGAKKYIAKLPATMRKKSVPKPAATVTNTGISASTTASTTVNTSGTASTTATTTSTGGASSTINTTQGSSGTGQPGNSGVNGNSSGSVNVTVPAVPTVSAPKL